MGATYAICEAQREAAIVTAIPGTTRDIVEISLDVEGLPVVVADTAGLRAVDDVVERIGIQRAAEAYVLCPLFRSYSNLSLLTFPLYKWRCGFAESGTLTFHCVCYRYWT